MNSKGEYLITTLLNTLNIKFEKQKVFPTCCYNNASLRFDFYLPSYNILIEYDGIQHYISQNSGWDTLKKLEKTRKYDEFKTNWCKENNIPLIRIPYTDFNLLSEEYLLTKIKEFQ